MPMKNALRILAITVLALFFWLPGGFGQTEQEGLPPQVTKLNKDYKSAIAKKDYKEAMRLIVEMERVLKDSTTPDGKLAYGHAIAVRGTVHDSLGENEEAINCLSKGVDLIIPILGATHPRVVKFRVAIASIYLTKLNKPEKFGEIFIDLLRSEVSFPVYFKKGKIEIRDDDSIQNLQLVASALEMEPLKNTRLRIEGHTDSDGDEEFNLKLSQKRADAIAWYLIKYGKVDPNRIVPEGKGEGYPLVSNDTQEGKSLNRRVVFSLLGATGSNVSLKSEGKVTKPDRHTGEWDLIHYQGQKYVSAANVETFYRFTELEEKNKMLVFKSPNLVMEWEIGSQAIFINKVKFVLSFPVQKPSHRPIVSVVDLAKLIDPVLRPGLIQHSEKFDTVVIDAGYSDHNLETGEGSDGEGYALDTAFRLESALKERGFKTHMTRRTDELLNSSDRVKIANSITDAIFVSVNFSSSSDPAVTGIETYALAPEGTESTNGGRASRERVRGNSRDGENIALATAVHAMAMHRLGMADRGVRRSRFDVLTGINKPAILFEGGYVTNPSDTQKIATIIYREKLANAIADAVVGFQKAVNGARVTKEIVPVKPVNPTVAEEASKPKLVGSGTALVIQDGWAITCEHVVSGAKEVYLLTEDSLVEATVKVKDKATDLAILKIKKKSIPEFDLARPSPAKVAQEVFTLGFPNIASQGLEIKYTNGVISSLSGYEGDAKKVQTTTPVQTGNSGGPLFDSGGRLVGVIMGGLGSDRAENVSYAVKGSYLTPLLESLEGFRFADGGEMPEERTELVAMVRKSVVIVLVYE